MPLRTDIHKVLVIGSGPIVIGQAAEFDYAGTQACLALKEENIEVVLINNNPATIMTDEQIADNIYIEPLTVETIDKILTKEKPDGVIGTLGGQTGLNLAVELYEKGILAKHGVELLGTSVESIKTSEDREAFRELMINIQEPISESRIVHTFEEGQQFVEEAGFPVIIRPAYTLGGSGGGFAYDEEELETVLKRGLTLSPIHQVLIEKSIKGWKEIEYEVMRDANDTCVIVCNMENLDPVGVHTGDSIVVAPSQTLTDVQYQLLRSASLKIIRALNIVGGCNIQFALNPHSDDYIIIEVNPRVSRSSALASKATGYPIARTAAKCAIGFNLDEIINPITGTTYASFEPALDYAVVKLPRFPFDKFTEAERKLGTQMKATGEVMAIDRTFEGALNKGLRSLEMGLSSLHYPAFKEAEKTELLGHLTEATDLRLYAMTELFVRGMTVSEIHEITEIDPWFLEKMKSILEMEQQLSSYTIDDVPKTLMQYAKQMNISDHRIAELYGVSQEQVRAKWQSFGLAPGYKLVDTCAAEFEAQTPYYYSTWTGEDEASVSDKKKILVIGSGPIRIGQGIEFDYCSVQAALAVKKKGYEAIVINNNPETVSTDFSVADRLYFEPLALEDILNVIEKEQVEGVLLQFGGQTAINLANGLEEAGIPILGTSTKAIDQLEDRQSFYDLLNTLKIPHIEGTAVHSIEELRIAAKDFGFPILVRPSYVIGGQAMFIFYEEKELERYIENHAKTFEQQGALLVDRYLSGVECEVDAISDGSHVHIPGVFEHIEKAGVHSGDSTAIFPAVSLSEEIMATLTDYTMKLCKALNFKGLMNIQFVIDPATAEVNVLEVNPRSSRTVPIVSKVTGVPMVEAAVSIQLGESLADQGLKNGLATPKGFYAVKAPVFSTEKLKDVDPALGPEMKSTGERLGLGKSLHDALIKAILPDEINPFQYTEEKPYIFCSVTQREQAKSLELIQGLQAQGFKIVATPRTASYYQAHAIAVENVVKDEETMKAFMAKGQVAAIINIPTQGRNHVTLGFYLRELALRFQMPLYTSLDIATSIAHLDLKKGQTKVQTLTEYCSGQLIHHGE
ncbi:carbamoyl-phosphate synthase large subunit [Pullulanibacillus pueri]|uniref:Carbamoyl phosphate synthase large chain n=1 Tax=Pullulanibacillus pueri TaxID=1437324 RepID=A0A8J3EN55_9BACL|nr:carbamoyl-phosphate synthase (glutamine-hydrolyzing) large subunit [Pullulanibacillus pueri]MBM7683228.1 carbamoyl-phosphate synthase large subunit [Pullulanibacillus pueri]GGH85513.1 carbamoyl phosphate synthase large subunit [Pullulanibacillus pueri]